MNNAIDTLKVTDNNLVRLPGKDFQHGDFSFKGEYAGLYVRGYFFFQGYTEDDYEAACDEGLEIYFDEVSIADEAQALDHFGPEIHAILTTEHLRRDFEDRRLVDEITDSLFFKI